MTDYKVSLVRENVYMLETALAKSNIESAQDIISKLKSLCEQNNGGRKAHMERCAFCGNFAQHYAKGLCRNCYNRALRNGGDPAFIRHPLYRKNIKWFYEPSWQESFVEKIMPDMQFAKPKDFDETVEKAVESLWNQRAAAMIRERHSGKTLEQVADIHGVTKERVRQILAKCYRRATHRYERGLTNFDYVLGEQEKEKARKRCDEEEIIRKIETCEPLDTDIETIQLLLSTQQDYIQSIKITDLDLSVRSYNAIMRSLCEKGCAPKTLKDLFESFVNQHITTGIVNFEEWLFTFRNIGRKSIEETISKIEKTTGIKLGV